MKILGLVVVVALLFATAAAVWQHLRYLRTRRDVVQDRQPILYSGDAFHVVTFLRTVPGDDVIEAVRKLRDQLEGDDAVLIYAGKVVVNGLQSSQLGEVPWTAIVLFQYPSKAAYETRSATEGYRQAFAGFTSAYSHGMKRNAGLNLLLPQMLLGRRLLQIARREPSHFPLVEAADLPQGPDPELLLRESELGERAVLIVNLVKEGNAEQRAANRGYGGQMMGAMAEGGYGPMHIGEAVTVEGDADFDNVVLVYYPGVEFFADLMRSTFFNGIRGGKQLQDTQASITVPILSHL